MTKPTPNSSNRRQSSKKTRRKTRRGRDDDELQRLRMADVAWAGVKRRAEGRGIGWVEDQLDKITSDSPEEILETVDSLLWRLESRDKEEAHQPGIECAQRIVRDLRSSIHSAQAKYESGIVQLLRRLRLCLR